MQSVIFDMPIRNCPSADNIMISIDVAVQLRVKPGMQSVRSFCFKTNPAELSNLLEDSLNERIRILLRGKTHLDAYSIKGKECRGTIITHLNNIFDSKGIEIEDVSIMEVGLPNDVANTLEQKTAYQCKNELQRKKQCFELMVLQDNQALSLIKQSMLVERQNEMEKFKKESAQVIKEHKYHNH